MSKPSSMVDPKESVMDYGVDLDWHEPIPIELATIRNAFQHGKMPEPPYRVNEYDANTAHAMTLQESLRVHHGVNSQLIITNLDTSPEKGQQKVTNMYGLLVSGEKEVAKLDAKVAEVRAEREKDQASEGLSA